MIRIETIKKARGWHLYKCDLGLTSDIYVRVWRAASPSVMWLALAHVENETRKLVKACEAKRFAIELFYFSSRNAFREPIYAKRSGNTLPWQKLLTRCTQVHSGDIYDRP